MTVMARLPRKHNAQQTSIYMDPTRTHNIIMGIQKKKKKKPSSKDFYSRRKGNQHQRTGVLLLRKIKVIAGLPRNITLNKPLFIWIPHEPTTSLWEFNRRFFFFFWYLFLIFLPGEKKIHPFLIEQSSKKKYNPREKKSFVLITVKQTEKRQVVGERRGKN